jgi:hypothetical protein
LGPLQKRFRKAAIRSSLNERPTWARIADHLQLLANGRFRAMLIWH